MTLSTSVIIVIGVASGIVVLIVILSVICIVKVCYVRYKNRATPLGEKAPLWEGAYMSGLYDQCPNCGHTKHIGYCMPITCVYCDHSHDPVSGRCQYNVRSVCNRCNHLHNGGKCGRITHYRSVTETYRTPVYRMDKVPEIKRINNQTFENSSYEVSQPIFDRISGDHILYVDKTTTIPYLKAVDHWTEVQVMGEMRVVDHYDTSTSTKDIPCYCECISPILTKTCDCSLDFSGQCYCYVKSGWCGLLKWYS